MYIYIYIYILLLLQYIWLVKFYETPSEDLGKSKNKWLQFPSAILTFSSKVDKNGDVSCFIYTCYFYELYP
jgi:hypothetical protein